LEAIYELLKSLKIPSLDPGSESGMEKTGSGINILDLNFGLKIL
jgi:hypothetical protein